MHRIDGWEEGPITPFLRRSLDHSHSDLERKYELWEESKRDELIRAKMEWREKGWKKTENSSRWETFGPKNCYDWCYDEEEKRLLLSPVFFKFKDGNHPHIITYRRLISKDINLMDKCCTFLKDIHRKLVQMIHFKLDLSHYSPTWKNFH